MARTKIGAQHEYKFTVTYAGSTYDVYRFRKDGKVGTLAFTKSETTGRFEIAIFCKGNLTEKQVCDKLEASGYVDYN